jgi:pyruvate/2-oxoglutarate dehydrogenase complex dihydrolipoamide acyltransferase (E2) component
LKDYEVVGYPANRAMTSEFLEWSRKHRQFHMTAVVNVEKIAAFMEEQERRLTPVPLMAILLKAFGMTVREHPEARTLYYTPPSRLVRFEHCTATVPAERDHEGERFVFFVNIKDCDTRTLRDMTFELERLKYADIRDIPEFEWWVRLSRMPRIFRKALYLPLQKIPFIRAVGSGVFGVTMTEAGNVDEFLPMAAATVTFAVGSMKERPVAENGVVVARKTLAFTVLFDQRAIDNAPASRFFEACVRRVENPEFLEG